METDLQSSGKTKRAARHDNVGADETDTESKRRRRAGSTDIETQKTSEFPLGEIIRRARSGSNLNYDPSKDVSFSMWKQTSEPPVARRPFNNVANGDNDNSEEGPSDDSEVIDFDLNTPITPTFAGFQKHVIEVYPLIERTYLVDRIAQQQVIRYKALLQWRVKHENSIAMQNCPAEHHCIALGGSPTLLDPKTHHFDSTTFNAGSQGLVDVSDEESNPEGAPVLGSFPPGVPLPPAQTLPAEFECQLCFRVKKFLKPSDWTKHVHEDVQPFTCTFANCRESKSCKRKADWVRHENERHRHLSWWTCSQENCEHTCYRKDNFLQHLVREHKIPEPKWRSEAAARKARDDEAIWVLIRNCHHETTAKPQDEPCKFCGKVFNTWKKLTIHLAKHMELISLSVLRIVERQTVSADTVTSPVELLSTHQAPFMHSKETDSRSSNASLWYGHPTPHITPPAYPLLQSTSAKSLSQFSSPPFAYATPDSLNTPNMPEFMHNQNIYYTTTTDRQEISPYNDQAPVPQYQNGFVVDNNQFSFDNQMWPQMNSVQSQGFPEMDQTVNVASPAGAVLSAILQPPLGPAGTPLITHPSETFLDQEFDLQSIASLNTFHDSALGPSNPSTGSISSMQDVPQSVQQEVLLVLHSNAKLRLLLEEAARKANNDRFTRNIRRALIQYGDDLSKTAADDCERAVTIIIRRYSQWIASNLFAICGPDRNTSNQWMRDQENPKRLKHEEDNESLSACSDDNMEEDLTFPELDHLETFLTGGKEFEGLQTKISNFVRPEKSSIMFREDEYAFAAPTDETLGLATTGIKTKIGMHPEPKEDNKSTQQAALATTENLPDIGRITTVADLVEVDESQSRNISTGSGNSNTNNKFLIQQNRDLPAADLASMDSQIQYCSTIEESYQESTSTEKTDVSLMDYEIDQSDDEFGSSSVGSSKYADAKIEERLSNPRSYFKKLEKLEWEIYDTSSVWIYKRNLADTKHIRSADSWCRVVPLDGHADDLQRSIKTLNEKTPSYSLMRLLESYNIVQRSYHNMQKLQASGFCGGYISVLVERYDRRGVASLVRIWHAKVLELCATFESALRIIKSSPALAIKRTTWDPIVITSLLADSTKNLTQVCCDLLTDIGLKPSVGETPLVIWQRTSQTIDFAVLSYVGAHIERFDEKFLGTDEVDLQLPKVDSHFADIPEEGVELGLSKSNYQTLGMDEDHGNIKLHWRPTTLMRRKLRCLDNFLGGMDVWVFHQGQNASGDERLFLSTDIETLTDIWGPLWKILRISSPGHIERLEIGNGSIVPWASPLNSDSLNLQDGETYCHWISNKTWSSQVVEGNQAGLERNYFLDTDRLLVGATQHGLLVNEECKLTMACLRDIKSSLHDQSALQRPGTDRPRRYADSYALQVQGSVLSMVSGAATVTYKRRDGQNMKDTLVERWRHSKNPNPGELESFCGVEVSICTQNARRRRLLELLNSTTMRKYLKGIFFEWISDDCESAYFESLSSRHTFRKFWNRSRDWRRSASEAISLCLDKLEVTGIDKDNGELSAFWADTFDDDKYAPIEEWLVKLVRREYTWSPFLRDSPEVLTMAIMESRCLDFNEQNGYGRRCQRPQQTPNGSSRTRKLGFPVLETALHVNEQVAQDLIKDGKLEKVETGKSGVYAWGTEKLKKNTKFSLGIQGTLIVYAHSNCCCPPIMSWRPIVCETLHEFKTVGVRENMIGEHEEKHHHEYISGSWSCKPLRVLILSKSTGKDKAKKSIRERFL